MPFICFHLSIAMASAERVQHPVLSRNLGSYLMGATLPDAHLVNSTSRLETHFFDLQEDASWKGTMALFQNYPQLSRKEYVSEPLRALVAGYLSHLMTDEAWILQIYRPFFSPPSPLSQDPQVKLLDRALQWELDLRALADHSRMLQILAALDTWKPETSPLPFDMNTLGKWHKIVRSSAARQPGWETFSVVAKRFLSEGEQANLLPRLSAYLQRRLAEVLRYVPRKRLVEFEEQATRQSVAAAREYLGCE